MVIILDDILVMANELASLIRNSPEVRAFLSARGNLQADAVLKSQLAAFQAAHQNFVAKYAHNAEPDIEEERAISAQYTELTLHAAAREYLEAERALLGLVSRVMDVVSRSVEGIVEV